MESPFQQAAGKSISSPYGYGYGMNLPMPQIGTLMENAFGIEVPQSYASFTPKQFGDLAQAKRYYEQVNPDFAYEQYWKEPQNAISYITDLWQYTNRARADSFMDPIPLFQFLDQAKVKPEIRELLSGPFMPDAMASPPLDTSQYRLQSSLNPLALQSGTQEGLPISNDERGIIARALDMVFRALGFRD